MSSNLMWFLAADSTCLRLNRFAASGATGHQMRGGNSSSNSIPLHTLCLITSTSKHFSESPSCLLECVQVVAKVYSCHYLHGGGSCYYTVHIANTLTMWIGSIIMLWTEVVLATASIYLLTYTHMATSDILSKAVCSDVLPHQGTQQHSFFFLCSCF